MYRAFLRIAKHSRERWARSRQGIIRETGYGRHLACETLEDRRLLSIGAEGEAFLTLTSSADAQTVLFSETASTDQSDLNADIASLELDDQGEVGISGQLSISGVLYETISTETSDFTRLEIPDWSTTDVVGQPELPVFRTSISIPADVEIIVEFTTSDPLVLATEDPIYPTQPLTPDLIGWEETEEASIFWYDTDYYADGDSLESELYWVSEPLIAGDNHSIAIEFYPFQYDAETGNITVVTDFEFELTYQESTVSEEVVTSDVDLVAAAADADYLIITADAYYDEVLPLAEWKHLKGYKTYVATMSEVGTTEEDVYNYLKAAYDADSDKPEYVLLVGDHEDIPSCEIVGHPYYDETFIWYSDYDYSRLSGDDVLADVALGRLPGDTEAQITTMVNKILTYECTPDTTDRYDDILLAGMFQDSNDGIHDLVADRFFMEDLHRITDFLSGDYDFWDAENDPYDKGFTVYTTRVWESSTSEELHYRASSYPGRITPPDPLPDSWKFKSDVEIAATINNGVGIVFHRDHGSSSGWGSPSFRTSNVNALTNGDLLPVVFSLNCGTGQFANVDAFAEAWLRNENGGAVTMTGAASVSYSGPNDSLHVGIFDSMWADYNTSWTSSNYQASWHFGQLMNYAKDRVFSGYGYSATNALLTARLYNVLGDPELTIRTETPDTLEVSHPTFVFTDTPYNFTVNVTQDGLPVEDATVAITCGDDLWTGQTNASGSYSFYSMTTSETGTYNVVVTERNSIPYQGTFISLAGGGTDLLGTAFDVTPDNVLLAAGALTTNFSVQNLGNISSGDFDITFYLSDDATIDPGADLLLTLDSSDPNYDPLQPAAYHVANLTAIATLADSVTLAVPTSDPFQTDNEYFIGMFIDVEDTVVETDETNNHSQAQDLDYDDVDFTLGSLDHFVWDIDASAKYAGVPFSATLTAVDENGLTITDFDGSMDLSGWIGESAVVYSSDFEANDGGWTPSATWDTVGDWEWGIPTTGPDQAHSGQNAWATLLDENYTNADGSSYLSQTFDFSGLNGVTMSWQQWIHVRFMGDVSRVLANGDVVYLRQNFWPTDDYEEIVVDLSNYDNLSSVEITFELNADSSNNRAGWYIDDITISAESVSIAVTPSSTGTFVDGVWTGYITVSEPGENIRLLADDGEELVTWSDAFDVIAGNPAPTDIELVPNNVDENQPAGTVVGTLATTDANPEDAFTYALVSGEGDEDNGYFTIDGDLLKTAAEFNHEMKDSYSIRIQTTDSFEQTYEKVLFVTVNDLVEEMLPGDANDDHTVDSLDHAILSANWGTTSDATWRMGDFNRDGRVNAIDASILAAHWGATLTPPKEETDEPTTPDNTLTIGPLPSDQTNTNRHALVSGNQDGNDTLLLEPLLVRRDQEKTTVLLSDETVDSILESSPTDDLAGESSLQAEATACDVVISTQYGPQQDEQLDVERQSLAWSYAQARRNNTSRETRELYTKAQAVEILFAGEL